METIPLFGPYALRRLRTEDAPDIFASIDTQRRHLGRWLPFVADTHRIEQTRQVVAGMLADTANPVFTLRSGNAFAGLIGFKSADAARRSVEIGYWLREEQQGKGIMTAAVRTLCDLAFGEMGGVSRSAAARATSRATAFRSVSASSAAMSRHKANSSPTESGST